MSLICNIIVRLLLFARAPTTLNFYTLLSYKISVANWTLQQICANILLNYNSYVLVFWALMIGAIIIACSTNSRRIMWQVIICEQLLAHHWRIQWRSPEGCTIFGNAFHIYYYYYQLSDQATNTYTKVIITPDL